MARRDQPFLPLYVQDFLTDEKLAECSAESTGVYIRLLCLMHKSHDYGKILLRQKDRQNEQQVLNFAVKLARQMPYTFDVIARSLNELIDEEVLYIDGDALCQKRMIKDGEISDIRANSGKKGAEKANAGGRKKDNFAEAKQSANNTAKQSANSENEIETENEYENDNKRTDKCFEMFWQAYPKKVGKQAALKAFQRVKTPVETLLTAIERQKCGDQWSRENGRYIPNPATWLNQGRWDDEVYTPPAEKGTEKGVPIKRNTATTEDVERMKRLLEKMKG